MKLKIFIVMLLFALLAGCGKKGEHMETSAADREGMKGLFGSNTAEAAELLGIEEQELLFRGSETNEDGVSYDRYELENPYLLGMEETEAELFFCTQQTPQGTPIGLCFLNFRFADGEKLEELVCWIEEQYDLSHEMTRGEDSSGKLKLVMWYSDQGEEKERERQAPGVDEAVQRTFGESYVTDRYTIAGMRKDDGTGSISISGIPAAIGKHLDDFAL